MSNWIYELSQLDCIDCYPLSLFQIPEELSCFEGLGLIYSPGRDDPEPPIKHVKKHPAIALDDFLESISSE